LLLLRDRRSFEVARPRREGRKSGGGVSRQGSRVVILRDESKRHGNLLRPIVKCTAGGDALFGLEIPRRLDGFVAELPVRAGMWQRETLCNQKFLPQADIGAQILET
jgi:hypothetical protein